MPGGKYDSSKTRVAPTFDALRGRPDDWPRRLLSLAAHGSPKDFSGLDLSFVNGHWGEKEARLQPSVALLSWLIRNPEAWAKQADGPERQALRQGDPKTVAQALELLRSPERLRAWWLFEGPTSPDALIETPDALIVVEGKRTEHGPTTRTTWLERRHQIWRHIDAAWEIRGRRRVFGLFIVGKTFDPALPADWPDACAEALNPETLEASFPHRSLHERREIAGCFLGATTWGRVCSEFDLRLSDFPE